MIFLKLKSDYGQKLHQFPFLWLNSDSRYCDLQPWSLHCLPSTVQLSRVLICSSPWHASILLSVLGTHLPQGLCLSCVLILSVSGLIKYHLPSEAFPEHLLKIMTSHTCTLSPSFCIISTPSSSHRWWMLLYIVCIIYFNSRKKLWICLEQCLS